MRAVINILSYFASKRETKITLIVSTTGDTGPAGEMFYGFVKISPFMKYCPHFIQSNILIIYC